MRFIQKFIPGEIKTYYKLIAVWVYLIFSLPLNAQISSIEFNDLFNNPNFISDSLKYTMEVKKLYNYNNLNYYWLRVDNYKNLNLLSNYIKNAKAIGLKQEDYQPNLFSSYVSKIHLAANKSDSFLIDIKFTYVAISFLHDVLVGNRSDQLSYNGLNYVPSCYDFSKILYTYLTTGDFSIFIDDIVSKDNAYKQLKIKLNIFQKMEGAKNFKDAILISSKVNKANPALQTRLFQLGLIENDTIELIENTIIESIKKGQKLFNIKVDGILNQQTMHALNIPLRIRILELISTLNNLRWLNCISQEKHLIVVNIPSATLILYEHGKMKLESKIIVGKKTTPTPTLSSKITDVILYPYWHVPNRIAIHELLPAIKNNRKYLESNNFQILNKQDKVINPSTINWQILSSKYFPYQIRQSTGCDNSLGLIKLNFFNPYNVYLHDTPGKKLFNSNQRYFSHGCMRLQKAVELARYILQGKSFIMDSLITKGCLYMQAPMSLSATESIPLIVLYNPAWVNSLFEVVFHEDIYNKFSH